MDTCYRPTRVEISLDALRHNVQSFRRGLPVAMKMMAVVKGNAYGHGAIEIAREAEDCGFDYLGVAFLDEALELRKAGITIPILVLGYTPPEGIALAAEEDISITVYSDNVLDALAQRMAVSLDPAIVSNAVMKPLKIHIKIDSGMGRLGLNEEQGALTFIEKALQLPGVLVEGLYTHYACADEQDKSYTYEQHRRFDRVVQHFHNKGIEFPYLHAGNSAAAIELPELSYSMIRLGISLYGLYPSPEVSHQRIKLRPVMSFKTEVVMVKTLPANSAISYGSIYVTQTEEQIATLPVGYADGYSRMLTGRVEALIRGRKVPVVGRICMDQCMINVTGIPDVKVGEEVVLIGEQGGEIISAEDLADSMGTVNYEIVCLISNRVPRMYMRDGKRVKIMNAINYQYVE